MSLLIYFKKKEQKDIDETNPSTSRDFSVSPTPKRRRDFRAEKRKFHP
jgi:hypothetical protein